MPDSEDEPPPKEPPDGSQPQGQILRFEDIGDKTVYNPTKPFIDSGVTYLAARVEPEDSETDSQIVFFEKQSGIWRRDETKPVFNLQDPHITRINDELILNGIEVSRKSKGKYKDALNYRTVFYRGRTLDDLKQFATSSERVKDVHLKQLQLYDNRIIVFTRPEEETSINESDSLWTKHIRYSIINSLDEIVGHDFRSGTEMYGLFGDGEWGAIDDIFELGNGLLGLLVHVGRYIEDEKKMYDEGYSVLNLETGNFLPVERIVRRCDFPEGPVKRILGKHSDFLRDVIYCGGGIRNEDGTITMYFGISDYCGGEITKLDPFESAASLLETRRLEPAYSP